MFDYRRVNPLDVISLTSEVDKVGWNHFENAKKTPINTS
jgi:hypothetical protein